MIIAEKYKSSIIYSKEKSIHNYKFIFVFFDLLRAFLILINFVNCE